MAAGQPGGCRHDVRQQGPYRARVRRVGSAAVFGGAAGLLIGSLIHGRGWLAVVALIGVAGVSAVLTAAGSTRGTDQTGVSRTGRAAGR